MDKKRHYVVVIKETGKSGLLITEYIGFITPEKVAEFFGLGKIQRSLCATSGLASLTWNGTKLRNGHLLIADPARMI
jgi:hypothetical protein